MANFNISIELVLKHEGGYSDHPMDRGGATNWGITHQDLIHVRGLGVTKEDVKNMTLDEAKYCYRKLYWEPLKCDFIAVQKIADVVFDQGVLCGRAGSTKRAQIVLKRMGKNITVDAKMGNATLSALNTVDPDKFCLEFICDTQDYFAGIVERNPTQSVFIRGWINRSQHLLKHCFELK